MGNRGPRQGHNNYNPWHPGSVAARNILREAAKEEFDRRELLQAFPRTVRADLLDIEIERVIRKEAMYRKDAAFTNPDPMYGADRSYAPMIQGGRRVPVRYD